MAWAQDVLRFLSNVLDSIVRCLCGGRLPIEDTEREELLVGEQSAELSDARQQVMVVMRHGHRMDEWDDGWVGKAERPWDPPLSPEGLMQAHKVASSVNSFRFDYLVTSPYQRCLQTSAQILSQLGLTLDNLLIDYQIGEVFNPRVMNGGIAGLPEGPLEKWMWKGKSVSEAIKEFVKAEPSFEDISGTPVVLDVSLPSEIETIGVGHRRYGKELERLAEHYSGYNLLVVTHGECIRVAVNSVLPNATVYESRHTGFVLKVRNRRRGSRNLMAGNVSEGTLWGNWRLITKSGATGVSWLL